MDSHTGNGNTKENVRHVSELSFDNPVFDKNEKPTVYKEEAKFDYSMVPPTIKFLNKTKRSGKKIAVVCLVWLILLIIVSIVIVTIALMLKSKKDSTKTQSPISSTTLYGEFTIVNFEFDMTLADKRTKEYRIFSDGLLQNLENVVTGTSFFQDLKQIILVSLSPGSIKAVVEFRSTHDGLKLQEGLQDAFQDALTVYYVNSMWTNYLGPYEIKDDWNFYIEKEDGRSDMETCKDITTSDFSSVTCSSSYTHAMLPNYLDHTSWATAIAYLNDAIHAIDDRCFGHSSLFLCSLLLPKCENNKRIPPCKKLCTDFFRKCRSQIPKGLQFISCDSFPNEGCIEAPGLLEIEVFVTDDSGVEMRLDGKWYPVCGSGYSSIDARVLCHNMDERLLVKSWTDPINEGANQTRVSLNCDGTERCISECEIMYTNVCMEKAKIHCMRKEEQSVSEVRLLTKDQITTGILQVWYMGQWGTVCDDEFGVTEARVACRMLGYRDTDVEVVSVKSFPSVHPSMPIWLDDVKCQGDEESLFECAHNPFGEHNCAHNEDVAISCNVTREDVHEPPVSTSTTSEPSTTPAPDMSSAVIRLSGGPDDTRGRLEIQFHDTWGTVCNAMFSDATATVFCRQLGFGRGRYDHSRYGPGSGPIWLTDVLCTGQETEFQECLLTTGPVTECSHIDDVSISCF